MDNQEKKDGTVNQNAQDGKACCSKGSCCGGKALAAFALLAIGGAGGYLAGKCSASKCAMPAAVQTPAK